MHRRVRLTLIGIGSALAIVALGLLVAVYLLLQPQRFTDLLRSSAHDAGLELNLNAPAEPTLWPQPALVLHGLTLSVQGTPMLIAVRGRLVLPWRTLFGGPPAITRLELDAPRLDLDALRTALARLPQRAGSAPTLPRIDAGIVISQGSLVRGQTLLLEGIHLETGVLAPGQAFTMQLSARGASGEPYTFLLSMTPRVSDHVLDFDGVRIVASSTPDNRAQLDGAAQWRGGAHLSMNLHGQFTHAPDRSYAMALQLQPASDATPFVLGLKLDGPELHADLSLPPLGLAAWWSEVAGDSDAANLPLPPLDGQLDAASLDVGGVHIEGLQLRAGSALPAATGSVPAAAASTAAAQ